MLKHFTLKDYSSAHPGYDVDDLFGQVEAKLAHLCLWIRRFYGVEVWVQVDKHGDFAQLLAIDEVIWIDLEGILVPQVVHFLSLKAIIASKLDLLAIESQVFVAIWRATELVEG